MGGDHQSSETLSSLVSSASALPLSPPSDADDMSDAPLHIHVVTYAMSSCRQSKNTFGNGSLKAQITPPLFRRRAVLLFAMASLAALRPPPARHSRGFHRPAALYAVQTRPTAGPNTWAGTLPFNILPAHARDGSAGWRPCEVAGERDMSGGVSSSGFVIR